MTGVSPDRPEEANGVAVISNGKAVPDFQMSISQDPNITTRWGSLWLANAILFLTGLQFSVFLASLYPYLLQIDHNAQESFFGYIIAVYSFGQMFASPAFGYYSNRTKQTRIPVAVGLILQLCGNVIFCFAEAWAPSQRKWVLLIARAIVGLGSGQAGVLRAYTATSSLPKDRHAAVSLASGSFALGMVLGPGLQAAYTPISYPGFVRGAFHLDMYTTAGYTCALANVIALVLLICFLKEQYSAIDQHKQYATKSRFHVLPKADRLAAFLCLWCWFVLIFCSINGETIGSPLTMAMFDWTKQEAVLYNGILQACQGLISLLTYIVLGTFCYSRVKERVTMFIGYVLCLMYYIITIPWPGTGYPVFKMAEVLNTTEAPEDVTVDPNFHTVGCEIRFEWCRYTSRILLPVYIVGFLFLSFGFPVANTVLSTLFSKVLGPRKQGLMQGLYVMCGSLARAVGPIFVSRLFESFGPLIPWLITDALLVLTLILLVVFHKRLVALNTKPKLKAGERFQFKNGYVYKF